MDITKINVPIGVVVSIVFTLGSGYAYVESTYAKRIEVLEQILEQKANVILVDMRLEQKIQSDRVGQIDERLYKIESVYGIDLKDAPQAVKDNYRDLTKQKEEIDRNLKMIQEKVQSQQYSK